MIELWNSQYAGVYIVFGLFGIALLFGIFTKRTPQEPYRQGWEWTDKIRRLK
jgi:hypothetical protein